MAVKERFEEPPPGIGQAPGKAKSAQVTPRLSRNRPYRSTPEVFSQAMPMNDPGLMSDWMIDSTQPGGEFCSQASTSSTAKAGVYGCCIVNAILGALA